MADVYPESRHVREVGVGGASEDVVWLHARGQRVMLVSHDTDF
ncbi:MAG: DUF5615 family PIN-like protein [Clostridia bacterium]